MTKLAIAQRYGLSTRDLRVFDRPSDGFPHILVREHTILIHLADLRVLVQHDHARLFHIAQAPTANHALPHSNHNIVTRVFSQNIEERLRPRSGGEQLESGSQPYELRVMDAALASVTSVLEAEYLLAEQQVSQALQMNSPDTLDGEETLVHSKLRTILELKRKLAGIEQRALQVRAVAQEILNEDEDMASMHLTDKRAGKPHGVQDHQDVEYLFEAYFKANDAVGQEAASLISHIRRTEETIQYTLNVRRNQIMVLEIRLEILMLAFAGATLVAGWYGMNVVNYFEDSAHAFATIVVASFAATCASSWYGLRKLRRIGKVRLQI
jgi:magnesium transporter